MRTLPADLLLVAQQLNDYFNLRLGPVAPFAHLTQDAAGLVAAVLEVQHNTAVLLADGILGPKTRAFVQGTHRAHDAFADAAGYLVVDGVRLPTPFATTAFDAPQGLSFLGVPVWAPREDETGDAVDLCVLHWDECMSSTHCFGVLLARGLSVHLMLDADGMVYQALDLARAKAWHARIHNERSVGIEIQNALLPIDAKQAQPPRAWVQELLPHTDSQFGHTDFTSAQKHIIPKLVRWLCDTLNIAKNLPEDDSGAIYTGVCPLPFAGVCGHYHLQTDKVDPGPSVWPLIAPHLQQRPRIA